MPPLRTTVIGSYPFPGWLEYAAAHLDAFAHGVEVELRPEERVVDRLRDVVVLERVDPDHGARIRQ